MLSHLSGVTSINRGSHVITIHIRIRIISSSTANNLRRHKCDGDGMRLPRVHLDALRHGHILLLEKYEYQSEKQEEK